MKKVIFYGDSNTYGFDPADMYEQRYPYEQRWTTIVARELGGRYDVFPEGMNGRRLPDLNYDQTWLKKLIALTGEDGILCTMLGTNDLLVTLQPDAEEPSRKMEAYIRFLKKYLDPSQILIVAPPPVGSANSPDPMLRLYHRENLKMNAAFGKHAARQGVLFADASEWGIGLAYDQVHFSEEGHRTFASEMIRFWRCRLQFSEHV